MPWKECVGGINTLICSLFKISQGLNSPLDGKLVGEAHSPHYWKLKCEFWTPRIFPETFAPFPHFRTFAHITPLFPNHEVLPIIELQLCTRSSVNSGAFVLLLLLGSGMPQSALWFLGPFFPQQRIEWNRHKWWQSFTFIKIRENPQMGWGRIGFAEQSLGLAFYL